MIEEVKKEETHAAMLQLIKGTQGPVFSEDTMLLYQAGKEVPVELAALATLRMWDAGPLLRMIEERRFPLIVVFNLSNKAKYTPSIREAIERSYSRTREMGQYKIYEPRSVQP